MIQVLRTFHRPDPSILWHYQVLPETSDFLTYFFATYQNEIISRGVRVDDPLTITFISVWTTLEAYTTSDSDPICNEYWNLRDQYDAENGITIDPPIITEL